MTSRCWEYSWSNKQTIQIHWTRINDLAAHIREFEDTSVRSLITALNAGLRRCPAGLCVAYSASKETWFLVYRDDKEHAARALLRTLPAETPDRETCDVSEVVVKPGRADAEGWAKWENGNAAVETWAKWENGSGDAETWTKWEIGSADAESWTKWKNESTSADLWTTWEHGTSYTDSWAKKDSWTKRENGSADANSWTKWESGGADVDSWTKWENGSADADTWTKWENGDGRKSADIATTHEISSRASIDTTKSTEYAGRSSQFNDSTSVGNVGTNHVAQDTPIAMSTLGTAHTPNAVPMAGNSGKRSRSNKIASWEQSRNDTEHQSWEWTEVPWEKVDELATQVVKFEETSFRTIISKLKEDTNKCPAGLGLMYSAFTRKWWLVYRGDKEGTAKALVRSPSGGVVKSSAGDAEVNYKQPNGRRSDHDVVSEGHERWSEKTYTWERAPINGHKANYDAMPEEYEKWNETTSRWERAFVNGYKTDLDAMPQEYEKWNEKTSRWERAPVNEHRSNHDVVPEENEKRKEKTSTWETIPVNGYKSEAERTIANGHKFETFQAWGDNTSTRGRAPAKPGIAFLRRDSSEESDRDCRSDGSTTSARLWREAHEHADEQLRRRQAEEDRQKKRASSAAPLTTQRRQRSISDQDDTRPEISPLEKEAIAWNERFKQASPFTASDAEVRAAKPRLRELGAQLGKALRRQTELKQDPRMEELLDTLYEDFTRREAYWVYKVELDPNWASQMAFCRRCGGFTEQSKAPVPGMHACDCAEPWLHYLGQRRDGTRPDKEVPKLHDVKLHDVMEVASRWENLDKQDSPTSLERSSKNRSLSVPAPRLSHPQRDLPPKPPATWDKSRIWRVVNLDASAGESVPIITNAEPFAPTYNRAHPPGIVVVTWLKNGDILRQQGHSKKVRRHMVMPVKLITADAKEAEGWVTRRHCTDHWREWFECVEEDPAATGGTDFVEV